LKNSDPVAKVLLRTSGRDYLMSSIGTESGIFETSVTCEANEQPRDFIAEIRDE
jgi:hypothetical protein